MLKPGSKRKRTKAEMEEARRQEGNGGFAMAQKETKIRILNDKIQDLENKAA